MEITASAWSTLSRLLDEGLEMDPEERARWLERVCAQHPALADTVRKLVAAHGEADAADALGTLPSLELVPRTEAGRRVGPYRLLRLLGAGGMGEVWLARRDDGVLDREVALKLPLLNPLRGDVAARFARERDILARLEHPHIARLYDAGVAEDGQPYLAMEHVQGQPITDFADGLRLGVPERLRLFAQVLGAVQFAHANLVLHRDLKPSNILVTDGGEVRLLDFGIAKLLEPTDVTPDGSLTEGHGRALTPAYASPEQILGAPLSTASDLYSLGVVLFELLTGVRPYRLELASVAQLELAIVGAEPLRPSAAVTEEAAVHRGLRRTKLSRRLSGDLDTVVLKALAKRPEDRMASVTALAEDLRRHLAGEPVLARPPSTLYRVQRFVARHRAAVAVGTGAAMLLVGLTAVAGVQARRATLQGRRAEAQVRNAEAVRDFLIDVLAAADPAVASGAKPPGEVTVREAVDAATLRIGTSLSGQPEVKVSVLGTLANVYSSLDQVDRSLALLEEALGVAETSLPARGDRQAWVLVNLANTAMFAGRYDVARRWIDRSESVLDGLHDRTSETYAQALKIRGNLLRRGEAPDLPRAMEVLERSTALFRERYPDSTGRLGALFFLAQASRAANAPARAEAAADEAVSAAATAPGFEAANAYSLRAAIRDSNGKLAAADEDYRVAHDRYARTVGPGHFLTLQNDLLHGFTLLERGGERGEALQLMESAATALGRSRRASNTHALALERLGVGNLRLGRYVEASRVLEEDRALWAERHEALQRTAATVALAQARAALGAPAEAMRLLDEALGVLRDRPGSAFYPEADVHLARGLLAVQTGDADRARDALGQAVTLSGRETREDLARRVLAEAALSGLALVADDAAGALAASERATEVAAAAPLAELPRIQAAALEARGAALCASGRGDEAEPLLSRSATLIESVVGPDAPPALRLRLSLARCLRDRGRHAEATALLEQLRRQLQPLGADGATVRLLLEAVERRPAPPR